MANFTYNFPKELQEQMQALEHAAQDAVIKRMLEAGGEKVEAEMKSQCRSHEESGKMAQSIRTTKANKNSKGFFVVTRPTGQETRPGKDGKVHTIRNMEKLAYLHYGTRRQPATGIVTKIVNRSEIPAIKAMQEIYNKEVILK